MAETNWSVADVAAVIAALATFAAALAAFWSAQSAKKAISVQRESEKSRLELQKKEVLIQRFQLLIADFAELSALAYEHQNQERSEEIRLLDKQIRRHCSVISSLSPDTGKKLQEWSMEEVDGCSNAWLISYNLASMNAHIGEKHRGFFEHKSVNLLKIHEEIFSL